MHFEEIFIWGKKRKKTSKFHFLMTITNSPLVGKPIKMQDLHYSTSWVILKNFITATRKKRTIYKIIKKYKV